MFRRSNCIPLCLLAAATFSFCCKVEAAPQNYLKINSVELDTVAVGTPTIVTIEVQAFQDLSFISTSISVSEGYEVLVQPPDLLSTLDSGQTTEGIGSIEVVASSMSIVTIWATAYVDDSIQVKANARLVLVPNDSVSTWWTLSDYLMNHTDITQAQYADSESFVFKDIGVAPEIIPTVNDSTWTDDTLSFGARGLFSVYGDLYYHHVGDAPSELRPAPFVTIQVWDDDSGPFNNDDLLGQTMTDWAGHFSLDGLDANDHCLGCGGVDVYLRYKLENSAFKVLMPSGSFPPFSWISNQSFGDVQDGTYLNFGQDYIAPNDPNVPAMWIYQFVRSGWTVASTYGPNPGLVAVVWPVASGSYYNTSGSIYIEVNDCDAIDIVNHEYGHFLMDKAYGDDFPDADCPSPHSLSSASNPICAWTEGWADFFPLVVTQDRHYDFEPDDIGVDIEIFFGQSGASVEGRVAGALLDLMDENNDFNDQNAPYNISFEELYTALRSHKDDTFEEYWNHSKYDNFTNPGSYMGIRSISNNTMNFTGIMRGDVDADDIYSISDIVYLINYIFSGGPAPVPYQLVGDVDCNGIITISDQVFYINWLFASGPAPCTFE